MSSPAEPRQRRKLGWLAVASVGFILIAPEGFLTLPLAALLWITRPQRRGEVLLAALATGFSLWWLAGTGVLPDQTLRAAAVFGTTAFAATVFWPKARVTHRSLLAVAVAFTGLLVGFLLTGQSWSELHWWVEQRSAFSARYLLNILWAGTTQGPGGLGAEGSSVSFQSLQQLDAMFEGMVQTMADFFPAIAALQLLLGFALATAIVHRVTQDRRARRLGALQDFRFSEHLGWAAVIPLALILIPRFEMFRIAAGNVLVVITTLYALRGVAVAAFVISGIGVNALLLTGIMIIAVLFMLPLLAGSAIILGVLDSGVNIRRRVSAAQSGE